MGIDCETVVGIGAIVDIDEFRRIMDVDDDLWDEVCDESDPRDFIGELAHRYNKKLKFIYNSYDGMCTVFVTTVAAQVKNDGAYIKFNLDKISDGVIELQGFLDRYFPGKQAQFIAYSITTA